jgi:PAS domain S-box-containing protein
MPSLPAPDFRSLFESSPGLYLILLPDLTITAVSDAYLKATMTNRDEIIGRKLFDVFPDNPDDPEATGVSNLRASLILVREKKIAHTMAVQKYDIRRPDGNFEERFWSPLNKPVLNANNELLYIIHRVEDVTEFVRIKEDKEKQEKITKDLHRRVEEMEAEIFKRAQEIQYFNTTLQEQINVKTAETLEIFERITDGFVALDKNFCYTYVNRKAGEITHRDPAALIGKNVWEEFPHAVESDTYKAFMTAWTEQRYVCNTDYYAPLDLWQENHIYPSPNGLSIFIRDVSGQKKSEKHITQARDLADKLIDSLPGVFYFFDATGKFIRWNRQFEEVTGYSATEIAGMHPTDFFEGEEKQYISERIMGVFEKGINDAEANFLTKKGEKIPYYFKAVLLNYEDGPCLLGNGIDITKRKLAEEELKRSEQKYKLLFESNPLPMWMINVADYKFIDINNAAIKQYGYTREEFLKMTSLDLRLQEDLTNLKKYPGSESNSVFLSGVWRHKKKDGKIIFVDINTHDFIYNQQPTRLVLANNVTEKYKAEEKLKESYDAIRQLTEHLQNIREEERSHMAREIHDQLGQLLTVLKMDVSWLNKRLGTTSEPIQEKFIELLAMIDKTVSTVRKIASELRPTLLDDLGLTAAMEWHLEEFEKRSGIHKEFARPANELEIDESMKIGLFRIFQESLTNVARHSGAEKVNVMLERRNGHIVLKIADNGKGFDAERAARKTLGLLGMKERTQMMGGVYHISGAPGKGTLVEVVVPLPESNE